jgi:RNA polymerase sigma factor (sigma-70 family)
MERAVSNVLLATQLESLYTLGAVGSLTDHQLLERFLARADEAESEAAFAALVERHGAMVLTVCQRILQQHEDARDAFQATFLVLARRARSIHGRGALGAWLFGIARRVASRARGDATRRRRLEKFHAERLSRNDGQATTRAHAPEPDYGDLIAAIDRLPERLRTPVVLHYFEGLGTEEVAQRLGCPRGTVLSRLARARERLRRRLDQRGLSLEILMPAASASHPLFSGATVPASLVQSTVRAAHCLRLAGSAIDAVVPASVAALTRGVARNLMFGRVRVALVLIFGMTSAAIGLLMAAAVDEIPGPTGSRTKPASKSAGGSQLVSTPKADESQKGDTIRIRGQVLDPVGKPVAVAQIVLGLPKTTVQSDWSSPRRVAISGSDGRFEFALARASLALSRPVGADLPVVAALAPGLGPDWVKLDTDSTANALALRLRRDDVPIEGRVTDPEGRAVPGLTVSAALVADFPTQSLKKLEQNAGSWNDDLFDELFGKALILAKEGFIPSVRSEIDGRFRLTGVGRDRAVLLLIEGESFEQARALVYTSSDPAFVPPVLPAYADFVGERLFGPRFDFTVRPGRVIEGTIRESHSGRPVSGVKVRSGGFMLTTTSDALGRFRLPGQPKKPRDSVEIITEGQPYIQAGRSIGDAPGLGAIRLDIAVKRGVWIEGRVRNQANGQPVRAIVQYYPLRDNPHLKECPDASYFDNNLSNDGEFPTDADGKFRAVALPGSGILTVRTIKNNFLTAKPLSNELAHNVLHNDDFQYVMNQYQALVQIKPADVDTVTIAEIMVVPGRIQHVQVVGADGKQVADTPLVTMLPPNMNGGGLTRSHEFTFMHPEPGKDQTVLIVRQDETAGAVLVVKGDEPDPITIKLQATATVTGRLVDEKGRPRPNVPVVVHQHLQTVNCQRYGIQPPTGPDGRFRISGLVPGVSYSADAIEINKTTQVNRFLGWIGKPEWTVRPGEAQDWGDVQARQSYPLHPVNPASPPE